MDKEMMEYIKKLVEITEKNNKNIPLEMQVNVEIPVETAKEMLKIIERQGE